MASGAPVIATSVTGLPEVVHDRETGLLLEPKDITGLADALEAVATGQIDTLALSRAARALIEQSFDSRAQARALAALNQPSNREGKK